MNTTLMPRSVLCVEDDDTQRSLLQSAFHASDVTFACNAFEAIRSFNSRNYDVYVLEYWLPDWSGPALCREIRSADPHAPIIFHTNASQDRDRARALRAGATAFLLKDETSAAALAGRVRALLTAADCANIQARAEEERATAEELERRMATVAESVERTRILMNSALERSVRAKAMKAFFDRHGTKAHFERSWPQVFASVRANALIDD